MHIIAVDTSQKALDALKVCIEALYPQSEIKCFQDPMLAVKHGVNEPPDAIYTAIEMHRMDGFEAARMLRQDNPHLLINFIADDDTYRANAIRAGMNSYTVKPVTVEKLRAAEKEIW